MPPEARVVNIFNKCQSWQPAMMDHVRESTVPGLESTEFSFFLSLPIEIRNMIYKPFIKSAIVQSRPPLYGISTWQTPSFNYAHKLDLHVKRDKLIFRNMRFQNIYPLFTANRQIHDEISALIFSHIQHIKISGDFILGLAPTQPIFDMLERRPWLQRHVRSVCVELKLCGIHETCSGPGIDENVIAKHPLLSDRLRDIWDVTQLPFRLQLPFGMHYAKVKGLRNCVSLFLYLGNMGYEALRRRRDSILEKLLLRKSHSPEHNTLSDLAKILESFSQLEKVDFETEHHQLISLFPSPVATAMAFSPLLERGVEINVLLRKWQLHQWADVFDRNGLDRTKLTFWHENGGEVGLAYVGKTGGGMLSYGLVRYRISGCLETRSIGINAR